MLPVQVPLWRQRGGTDNPGGMVFWDYHTIALDLGPGQGSGPLVWDFDR